MYLQQVIELAKDSELRDLNVKSDMDAILGYINLGMIELYGRFTLKVEEYLFELVDGVTVYTMPEDYMWLMAAYGTVIEYDKYVTKELPINVEEDITSINTLSWNKVQVGQGVAGSPISLIYAASPEYLTPSHLSTHIELPPQMIEALLAFVGYRAYSQVPGTTQADVDNRRNKFKFLCDDIENKGRFNADDMSMAKRLEYRGFI
jgi:hypothetical protein